MTAGCCCKNRCHSKNVYLFYFIIYLSSLLSQNRISGFFTTSAHFCSRRIVSTNLLKQELNCLSYFSTMCTTIKTWWVGEVLCDVVCCCAFLSTLPPSFPFSLSPSLPSSFLLPSLLSLLPFLPPPSLPSLPSSFLAPFPPSLTSSFLPSFPHSLPPFLLLPPSLPSSSFLSPFLPSSYLENCLRDGNFLEYGEEKRASYLG